MDDPFDTQRWDAMLAAWDDAAGRPSPESAMLALFFAAVFADGAATEAEGWEYDALSIRAKGLEALQGMPTQLYQALGNRFYTALRGGVHAAQDAAAFKERLRRFVDRAVAGLEAYDDRKAAIFGHCLDLVHADGVVRDSELDFLGYLQDQLNVAKADREALWTALDLKNQPIGARTAVEAYREAQTPPARPSFWRRLLGAPDLSALAPDWDREDCIFAALISACVVDGAAPSAGQLAEVEALMVRVQAVRRFAAIARERDHHRYAQAVERVLAIVNQDGREALALRIAHGVGPGSNLAIAVYAHCADLIVAERTADVSQSPFLKALAKALRAPPKAVAAIDRGLQVKNQLSASNWRLLRLPPSPVGERAPRTAGLESMPPISNADG